MFVAFSLLYSKAKGYDVARLVEAGNAASAVSYGADLIVIAMLAANAVRVPAPFPSSLTLE